MRYMPTRVAFSPEGWAGGHRIYLLRGEDRSGGRNRYAPLPDLY